MSRCTCSITANKGHVCQPGNSGVQQTLDEMEFEKGLWGAAHSGDVDRLRSLLKKGEFVDKTDSAGYTALHYAARNGKLEACKLLLSQGASVDAVTRSGRATSLHRACLTGKLDVVQMLLEKKADIMFVDSDGKTSLHRAAESGNLDICKLLTAKCPRLKHITDNRGLTPFQYAKSQEVLTFLRD